MMSRFSKVFTRFASAISRWTGHPVVFIGCCTIVVLWALSGPIFGFSDTWQLVINTGTTIITFLMVFLIQNTQNRDNNAIHAKLDELIRVSESDNYFIGIENLPQEELEQLLKELDGLAPELRSSTAPHKVRHPSARVSSHPKAPAPPSANGAAKRPRPRRAPRAAKS
ncbi:low affinity iron permease family protein [Phenylobacterium sp. LH3H17]|uniref:low affinity iron permease family protein n=1 Tax=Phenylobacterium sp. LH3H17 TaxID=2903901 RepID=UPI0020C95B39|nr:low affinity iron permease family protein [Phenylobacterium sp. LH3H17]UTP41144.1 low affinity iron permease family protein [Phenylobacterium sp. LH3H17]